MNKRIVVTGGSGFLGTEIVQNLLSKNKYTVIVIDINEPSITHKNLHFMQHNLLDTFTDDQDLSLLKNIDTVIHLSGKNIFGKFTDEHKKLIYDTRIIATRNLVDLWKNEKYKPRKLVAASAVGYYGSQPREVLNEKGERKNSYFLSDVVRDWEAEALRATELGIEVTCIRNGHIIGPGGLLAHTFDMFKLGCAFILGSGNEYMPWIDIRDLVSIYTDAITQQTLPIVNGVCNKPVTQHNFSHAIGISKRSKFYIHVPGWILNLRFGSFGKEMLADQNVVSKYRFINERIAHDDINESVRYHLAKKSS